MKVSAMTKKRLLYLTLIIATLTIGVVIGTIVSGGVKAGEQKAQTLVIPDPVSLSNAFSQIAANLAPAVVNISTEAAPEAPVRSRSDRNRNQDPRQFDPFDFFNFFGAPDLPNGTEKVRSLGTGFILDKAGYIVTNHHVIDKATKITVRLEDKSEFQAKVIGSDEETDLALIKIDAGRDLPVAKMGNSEAVKVGDWVLAIGSPFTLDHTVTHGIISAKGRDTLPGGDTRAFQSFLQTDAAINPGNSGGPLVNMAGEVIGINTAIISETRQSAGLGFALPSNTAIKVYNQLVQNGKVTRGGIGIGLPIPADKNPSLCRAMGLKSDCGVIVESVTPGFPAAKAGIREGDVITDIDGNRIVNQSGLLDAIGNAAVGSTVRIKVLRDGREMTLPVTIADRTEVLNANNGGGREAEPERSDSNEAMPRLGLRIQDLTQDMVRQLRLPSQEGVYVSAVEQDSPADDAGIVRGTIITRIIAGNQRLDVRNVEDFNRIQKTLKSGQEVAFMVLQQRAGQYRSTFVPLTIP
jgi:serine protease Do